MQGLDALTHIYACLHTGKQSPWHALSSPLPNLPGGVFLRLDELDAREAVAGGRERKRLVRLIQLLKDLRSRSSCLPLSACRFQHASFLPLRAWGGREVRGNGVEMQRNETRGTKKENIKMCIAPSQCGLSSVSAIQSCGGCAFGPWSNNKPWGCSDLDCSAHTHTKRVLCCSKRGNREEGD